MRLCGVLIGIGVVAMATATGGLPLLVGSAVVAITTGKFVHGRMIGLDDSVRADQISAISKKLRNPHIDYEEAQSLQDELQALGRTVTTPGRHVAANTVSALVGLGAMINPLLAATVIGGMALYEHKTRAP